MTLSRVEMYRNRHKRSKVTTHLRHIKRKCVCVISAKPEIDLGLL